MKHIPRDIQRKLRSESAQINPKFKKNLRNKLFKESIMATKKQPLFKRGLSYVSKAPALAVFAALVLVGTSSALVATNRANTARKAEVEIPANLDGLLSFDKIRSIAAADAPDSSISGIELEKEDSGMVYKVKFADGSIRLYDATTGKAVTSTDDDEVEKDASVPKNLDTAVSAARAREIAVAERPGKTVTKIELETEEGVVVYSVRFSDGGRVDVSAKDGSVLRVRAGSTATQSGSGSSSGSGSNQSGSSNSGKGSDDSGKDEDKESEDDHSGKGSGSEDGKKEDDDKS